MSSRAILTCFHKFQPYGGEIYEPIFDFYLQTMKRYQSEFDHVYVIDSNWGILPRKPDRIFDKMTVINVNPSLRYYDAYKEVLPQIKEDLVLLMDNDMVVYEKNKINKTFSILEYSYTTPSLEIGSPWNKIEVISIYDTIGEYKTDKLNGKNKFCPYWFATRKDLLMKYLDVDWGSNMPHSETLGKLTETMLNDNIEPYEWEEDKSSLYFDGTVGYGEKNNSKNLGYYHIRAGSTPTLLLAYRKYDRPKFEEYINNQPKNEYLRQFAWYWIMGGSIYMNKDLFDDLRVNYSDWLQYVEKFRNYHGL